MTNLNSYAGFRAQQYAATVDMSCAPFVVPSNPQANGPLQLGTTVMHAVKRYTTPLRLSHVRYRNAFFFWHTRKHADTTTVPQRTLPCGIVAMSAMPNFSTSAYIGAWRQTRTAKHARLDVQHVLRTFAATHVNDLADDIDPTTHCTKHSRHHTNHSENPSFLSHS
jgi:hypothetical protein